MSAAPIELADAQLARLADMLAPRIADELRSRAPAGPELVDAAEIARRFTLSAEWVRGHADELGVIRVGAGERPRLRFDPEDVLQALRRRSGRVRSPGADLPVLAEDSPPAVIERAGSGVDALPLRQLKPSSTTQRVPPRRVNVRGPATRNAASPRRKSTRDRAGSTVGRRTPRRSDRQEPQ